MSKEQKNIIIITGIVGLLASILVGIGEFLLHFDPLARYSETSYEFMLYASNKRQSIGHFFGVLASPLYLVGCWHIYLMLSPANRKLAFITFLLSAYGFMIGGIWIGSRASIGALTHFDQVGNVTSSLVDLYQHRYETLLTIVRITTLILSIVYVLLVLSGRTHYQKWQAILNPILLLILSFVVYLIVPSVGIYLMPIALNVGFGLFFIMSVLQAKKIITTPS
jgi:hypothetical protein